MSTNTFNVLSSSPPSPTMMDGNTNSSNNNNNNNANNAKKKRKKKKKKKKNNNNNDGKNEVKMEGTQVKESSPSPPPAPSTLSAPPLPAPTITGKVTLPVSPITVGVKKNNLLTPTKDLIKSRMTGISPLTTNKVDVKPEQIFEREEKVESNKRSNDNQKRREDRTNYI